MIVFQTLYAKFIRNLSRVLQTQHQTTIQAKALLSRMPIFYYLHIT